MQALQVWLRYPKNKFSFFYIKQGVKTLGWIKIVLEKWFGKNGIRQLGL